MSVSEEQRDDGTVQFGSPRPRRKKTLKGSVSLPELVKGGRQPSVSEIVKLPEIKRSPVGASLIVTTRKSELLERLAQARNRGNMKEFRDCLYSCKRDPRLCDRGVVTQTSEEYSAAKHWMSLCEAAVDAFDPPSVGKLLLGIRELKKSRFGPMLWEDPMFRRLRTVQDWEPYLPVLRDLALDYKAGTRHYCIAWAEAVEGLELSAELRDATAKWFQNLPDAETVFTGALECEDVRLVYPNCRWQDREEQIQHVKGLLDDFQFDYSALDFRPACLTDSSGAHEDDVVGAVVVMSGAPALLGRVRRLKLEDLEDESSEVVVESAEQKHDRIASLLSLAGLTSNAGRRPSKSSTTSFLDVTNASPARRAARRKLEKSQSLLDVLAAREAQKREEAVSHVSKFRVFLMEKFGSISSAWKKALDTDGNNRLSYNEFCANVRNIGFKGDLRGMWMELDKDGTGHITFDELDPNEHGTLSTFEKLVMDNYGSFKKAWKAFDENNNGLLDEDEFTTRCSALGYPGDARKLFQCLLERPGARCLRLVDFDPRSFEESIRDYEDERYAGLSEKEKVAKMRAESLAKLNLPTDLPSLKQLLVRKYGSLAAAWKHGLDVNGNGVVHKGEFVAAAKDVGFRGNFAEMWALLDKSKNGTITLDELDPGAHEAIEDFKRLAIEKHGSFLQAWKALRLDRAVKVDEDRFVSICGSLGYEGDSRRLFKHLLNAPGARSITLADLDPSVLTESALDPLKDSNLSPKKIIELRKRSELEHDMAVSTYKGFHHALVARYGSIPAAMKHLLDRDGNDKVSFVEFCNALREVGYKGSYKELWREMSASRNTGDGVLTLSDFDKAADQALTAFKEVVQQECGGFLQAWDRLDLERQNRVYENNFVTRCAELGFQGDAHKLFKYFLNDPSADFITLADIDPVAAHEARLDPTRNDNSVKKRLSEQKELERKNLEKAATDVPSLIKLLLKKYGTLTSAWKHALDIHGNDRVSFVEFCRAMQQLAFKGNVRELWLQLDQNKSGHITLDELDPAAHQALTDFRELVFKTYGDFATAWEAFDADKNLHLSKEEFIKRCQEMGYTGDANRLFQYLLNQPGAEWLTFDDLDPQAAYESRLEPGRFDPATWRELAKHRDARRASLDMGASDFASLKKLLVRKFGTMPAAWKHLLDPGGNGRIGFVDFCKAMRCVSYVGSLRDLWKEIASKDETVLTLKHFDAKAHEALEQFKTLTLDRYKDWTEAWKAFDKDGNKFLDESEFGGLCADLGYDGNSEQLFRYLLDEPCSHFLTLADLDIEAANESYLDPDRGNGRAKFEALQRERAKQWSLNVGNKICDLPSVKTALFRQYGEITAAWRHAFDHDGIGRISYMEFCAGLRDIGFRGDIRELWTQVDENCDGSISLLEFDEKAYNQLRDFRSLALKAHGKMEDAWKAFDVNRTARVDESEFARGCEAIGYQGDAAKLFRYLLENPTINSHWLCYEDFDCQLTRRRGHHGYIDD